MSGLPPTAPGPQAQQVALPEYMRNIREATQQHEASEAGMQLGGCKIPLNKFGVGTSHFRCMPDFATIQQNMPALQAGQAPAWDSGFAFATFDLYMPARDDAQSKGMTLFPGKIKVSPATEGIPGAPAPQIDPAQSFLTDPNFGKIKYRKMAERSPLEAAIGAALFVRTRVAMQIVNFGKDGADFHKKDGSNKVVVHTVHKPDFHSSWRHYCFEEPFGHRRNVLDPMYFGVNLSVTREGTGQFDTSYGTLHAIYGAPYQVDGAEYGYPASMNADGTPDMNTVLSLLQQVVPWPDLFEWATADEVQNAMDDLMPRLEQRFGTTQVAAGVPGQPAAAPLPGAPQQAVPPAPGQGNFAAPPAQQVVPVAAPPAPPAPGVPPSPQTQLPVAPGAPAQQPVPQMPAQVAPQPGPAQAPQQPMSQQPMPAAPQPGPTGLPPPAVAPGFPPPGVAQPPQPGAIPQPGIAPAPPPPGAAPGFSPPMGQTAPVAPQQVQNVVGPVQQGAAMAPQQATQVAQAAAQYAPPQPPGPPASPAPDGTVPF